MSEEDKQAGHIQILGAPNQGKSRLIELMVLGDTARGYGGCVIDPGVRRRYGRPHSQALRPPALLHALHAADLTLAEARWFSNRKGPKSFPAHVQHTTLEHLPKEDENRGYLEEALFGSLTFWKDFQSTINQMNEFHNSTLRRFVGSKQPGIDWNYLIKNGWLVLVNLHARNVWRDNKMPTRLIGTLIINEINSAISDIFSGSGNKVYEAVLHVHRRSRPVHDPEDCRHPAPQAKDTTEASFIAYRL